MSSYLKIIKSPVITEKASIAAEKLGRYVLYVSVAANKLQIKKAIEMFYGVNVLDMNVLVIKGKEKRFKGILGRRKERKKVYFSLVKGQSLNIMGV